MEAGCSGDWEEGDEPYCARYMDKRVGSVQHRQSILMALQEPVLHAVLFDREKKACPAELLKLQNCQAVRLSNFYYRFCKNNLRKHLCQAVEEVGDDPVEHLDQERKLL